MKKISKIFFVVSFFVLFFSMFALPLFCQDGPAKEVDWTVAEVIFLTGIGGFSVTAIIAVVKRIFKIEGILVIGISVIVSAGATLFWLFTVAGGFVFWKFLVYTAIVSVEANGIHLIPRKREKPIKRKY